MPRPGMADSNPGSDVAAGAAGEAAAAGADRPGIEAGSPGTAEAAGAAGAAGADGVNPGIKVLPPGTVAVAAGAAAAAGVSPGMDGIAAAGAAAAGAAAAGVIPGKVMPGVAGAAGGVAPRAVARFCRICGALAAEAISCCGMFCKSGAGTGAGSAWAIPPVNSAADEPTTTAVARK
jgi:hypothetical protein